MAYNKLDGNRNLSLVNARLFLLVVIVTRLKSCVYCGKIHDSKYDCGRKPQRAKDKDDLYRFRNSKAWQLKREEIKERDNYLCQVCARRLYNTIVTYNTNDLSVHHIKPARQNWDNRLDNDILITLCGPHHEMAERGDIPASVLLEIVKEQEAQSNG